MALRTNREAARENVRRYITENFDCSSYSDYFPIVPETFDGIASAIWQTFNTEKPETARRESEIDRFYDWAAGLPSILDTCYYYNRSAVADLARILDESPAEAEKYTESDAESVLTRLIFREIRKAVEKNARA